jgi:CBS domain-containing protein
MKGDKRLANIAQQLREKKAVRQTESNCDSTHRNSPIEISLLSDVPKKMVQTKTGEPTESVAKSQPVIPITAIEPNYTDPTYRISKLAAAGNKPISVAPDQSLQVATTLMLTHDFSQLPVMTSEYDVKGIVTWKSIGIRLALGIKGNVVRAFMEHHQEIPAALSLISAIPIIVQSQYVLIRDQGRITGIVTASDLSLQFQQLAEPFLLLGEIENHIRLIIGDKFSPAELSDIRDSEDSNREVSGIYDLTFGQYIRLLQNPDKWKKIKLSIDRVAFCDQLDTVRKIRNDVMHFNPDPMKTEDLQLLRDFLSFLQLLQNIGVP